MATALIYYIIHSLSACTPKDGTTENNLLTVCTWYIISLCGIIARLMGSKLKQEDGEFMIVVAVVLTLANL